MSTTAHAHRPEPAALNDRLLYISLLGIGVGVCGGLIAEGLLKAIWFITDLLFFGKFSSQYLHPNEAVIHWWTALLPAAGGLLVGLMIHYFSPEIKGDGIPEAMSVVLTNRSQVKPRVGFFKPLSAAITVGTGGPFGAEGPIIQTGAAVGSIISQFLPASASERRTLLACGAAAGLAGVFKTPFAGVLMAVELLVFEFRARSFIPIALASTAGTLVAIAFRGAQPIFPLPAGTIYHLHAAELPFFILLAIGTAALAWLMTRTLYICEDFFESLKVWFPIIPAAGGLVVGIIGYFYPQVFGMGYNVIADVLKGNHSMGLYTGVGISKLAAFGVALGSGASGGTFAPALMIGGSLGAAFGSLVHLILPTASAVAIYGMISTGALFGGIYRATPTAILFMLEVTGAYNAMFPLFLVCIVSDLAIHYFMDTTINTEQLVRRGIPVPDAYVVDPMKLLRARDVMNPAVESIPATRRVREFLSTAMNHDTTPVVDEQNHVLGLIHRADLIQADEERTAADLARKDYLPAFADELVLDVALRLLAAGRHACPVLDRKDNTLTGMLTAYDVLKAKQWERMHEVQEPGTLRLFKMARWRSRSPARVGSVADDAARSGDEEVASPEHTKG